MESPPSLTLTQREQLLVSERIFKIYNAFSSLPPTSQNFMLELQFENHMEYLVKGLKQLPPSFSVLDANRPWLCYWILHSIALLWESIDEDLEHNAIDFLNRCQDPNGGYCGGPGQMPHLATTYAAVNALVTLGGDRALSSINRSKMYNFLRRMKNASGAFRMHDAGEIDVRACYTAISVASILNILDDELVKNVGNYILSCQTYEGGIGGEPGSEAHGGYTFCGLATMILIDEADRLDLESLIDWVAFRQGVELGFQGRANKLVDGCYSFWQGGAIALLERLKIHINGQLEVGETDQFRDSLQSHASSDIPEEVESSTSAETHHADYNSTNGRRKKGPLFDSLALQKYLLLCSQDLEGGFRDKPGKSRDFYHTCYCLSGLSVCQYSLSKDEDTPPSSTAVLGPFSNLLDRVHPLYNVVVEQYREAHEFFSRS